MIEKEKYSLTEHYHRYACWTAAQAIRRAVNGAKLGLKKTSFISDLFVIGKPSEITINQQKVTTINLLDKILSINAETEDEFKKYHINTSRSIIKALNDITDKDAYTYGIAAKIIGIYFKTIILSMPITISGKLIEVIHPPIDSILLENIAKHGKGKIRFKNENIKKVKWSKLNEKDYWALIETLKIWKYPISWRLEEHWTLSN